MNRSEFLYIFHGYGGENSLLPLAAYMKEQGSRTWIVDDRLYDKDRGQILQMLEEQAAKYSIIYVTSAHLWFDEYNYQDFFWENHTILSALEMMDILEPVCSVYYPHDLECFLHPSELRWLDLFDLVLLPYMNNDYYKIKSLCSRVEIVGWVKKQQEIPSGESGKPSVYSPVFFPSNISSFYQILGADGYAQWFIDHISPSIPLKMPGTDPRLRELLVEHGFTFLDPSETVYDVMSGYNLIIASGDSSIVFEAALSGLPVISLLDGMMPDETCLHNISGLKGVYPLHPENLNGFLEEINREQRQLETNPNVLKPFDFGKIYHLLTHVQ